MPVAEAAAPAGSSHGPAPASVSWLVLLLLARPVGFAVVQGLVAVLLWRAGQADPWARSAAWWPLSGTVTGVLTLYLLIVSLRRRGVRYGQLFSAARRTIRTDLPVSLAIAALASVMTFVPMYVLAVVMYGAADGPVGLLFQPLPRWVAGTMLVALPLSFALSELPLYFGHVGPELEARTGSRSLAVGLPALFLSLQHATLPLVLDGRFLAWRALMFAPLAVLFGVALRWRPRLLAHLVVLHLVADLQTAVQVWGAG